MKKIMFNDRYALTDAAIEGIKTNTRRIEGGDQFQLAANSAEEFFYEKDAGYIVMCRQGVEIFSHKCRYKLGEVVAVAQNYFEIRNYIIGEDFDGTLSHVYGLDDDFTEVVNLAGWGNKMFVRADLMPHSIRITGIKCEQLRNISDEECLREGISESWYESTDATTYGYADEEKGTAVEFDTPREAFASLIDKVSGQGTWEWNPWVVAYEFELVK